MTRTVITAGFYPPPLGAFIDFTDAPLLATGQFITNLRLIFVSK